MDDLLRYHEVAKIYGIKPLSVAIAVHRGRLKSEVLPGYRYLKGIRCSEVERYDREVRRHQATAKGGVQQ